MYGFSPQKLISIHILERLHELVSEDFHPANFLTSFPGTIPGVAILGAPPAFSYNNFGPSILSSGYDSVRAFGYRLDSTQGALPQAHRAFPSDSAILRLALDRLWQAALSLVSESPS